MERDERSRTAAGEKAPVTSKASKAMELVRDAVKESPTDAIRVAQGSNDS